MTKEKQNKKIMIREYLNMPIEIFKNMTALEQEKIISHINDLKIKIFEQIQKDITSLTFIEKDFLYTFSNGIDKKDELIKKYPTLFKDFYFLELYQLYRMNLSSEKK